MVLSIAALALFTGPVASGIEPGDDPEAGRPPVWYGQTGVAGVQVAFDPEPFLPVTDIVNVAAPEGMTEWDPTRARARAASAWPGGFVTGFPGLIVPVLTGSEPPPYEGAAQARHPDTPDDSVGGLATAHASRDHVESRATSQPSDASAQPGVIDLGSVTTWTRQHWEDDVLVSRAQTIITDIKIVEQIRIDSVKTTVVARSPAGGLGEASSDVTVSGVTVAGVPAVIDESGISIAGQGDDRAILGAGGAAASQAVAFLDELGQDVDIRLVGSSQDVNGSEARAEAGGLLISLTFEIISPTGDPLPGDGEVLTLANLVFDLMPDDVPKPIPPGPNTVFRKYFTTVALGKATARASTDSATFGSIGDLGGLIDAGSPSAPSPGPGDGAVGTSPERTLETPGGSDSSATSGSSDEVAAPDPRGEMAASGARKGSIGDPLLLAALPAERLETVLAIALLMGGLLFYCSRLLARRLADTP